MGHNLKICNPLKIISFKVLPMPSICELYKFKTMYYKKPLSQFNFKQMFLMHNRTVIAVLLQQMIRSFSK